MGEGRGTRCIDINTGGRRSVERSFPLEFGEGECHFC